MELRDRFGPLPAPLENFLAVLRVKRVLMALGAVKAELSTTRALLTWPEAAGSLSPETMIAFAQARKDRARLLPPARLELRLAEAPHLASALTSLADELAGLLPEPAASGREHAA
jgi:transcription-repair coupling factor (superfamily II helicase)